MKLVLSCASGVFVMALLVAVIHPPVPVSAQTLSAQQQLAHDIYKELVEINRVTATGDTSKAADAMAARRTAASCATPAFPRTGRPDSRATLTTSAPTARTSASRSRLSMMVRSISTAS
jgi:hypothetical protein